MKTPNFIVRKALFPGVCFAHTGGVPTPTCTQKISQGDDIYFDRDARRAYCLDCGRVTFEANKVAPVELPDTIEELVIPPATSTLEPPADLEETIVAARVAVQVVDEPNFSNKQAAGCVLGEPVATSPLPLTFSDCYCQHVGRKCGACVVRESQEAVPA